MGGREPCSRGDTEVGYQRPFKWSGAGELRSLKPMLWTQSDFRNNQTKSYSWRSSKRDETKSEKYSVGILTEAEKGEKQRMWQSTSNVPGQRKKTYQANISPKRAGVGLNVRQRRFGSKAYLRDGRLSHRDELTCGEDVVMVHPASSSSASKCKMGLQGEGARPQPQPEGWKRPLSNH
jgi:hypothetical protein